MKFVTRNVWEGGVECGTVTQTDGQVVARVDERWAEAQAGGPARRWTSGQTGEEMTKTLVKNNDENNLQFAHIHVLKICKLFSFATFTGIF